MDSDSGKKFWDLKPFWCQPWSIISFGILIFTFSWKVLNNFIVTSLLGLIISVWWIVFLILVPKSYQLIANKKQS